MAYLGTNAGILDGVSPRYQAPALWPAQNTCHYILVSYEINVSHETEYLLLQSDLTVSKLLLGWQCGKALLGSDCLLGLCQVCSSGLAPLLCILHWVILLVDAQHVALPP